MVRNLNYCIFMALAAFVLCKLGGGIFPVVKTRRNESLLQAARRLQKVILVRLNAREAEREVTLFVVVQPWPLREPLALKRPLYNRSLAKLSVRKASKGWLVSLVTDRWCR